MNGNIGYRDEGNRWPNRPPFIIPPVTKIKLNNVNFREVVTYSVRIQN